jgi:glutamyl/glutaminyl-tRNA synthetase
MILGPDGTRLSKRHGATSVGEYRTQGYLPVTMRNYLALLGWSNTDSQQIFKEGELEEQFDLKGCQKSPAVFDPVKLTWMNGEYIRQCPKEKLLEYALPYIKEAALPVDNGRVPLLDIVALEQEKYKLLSDVPGRIGFFFKDAVYDPAAVEKTFNVPEVKKILEGISAAYAALGDFREAAIEAATRAFAKTAGCKAGQVFHPVRVAVSGRTDGPTLFRMIEYLGKDEVIKRLAYAGTLVK